MKRILLGFFSVGLFGGLPLAADAADSQQVNCGGLRDLPALCFKNNGTSPIKRIVTSNTSAFGSDTVETNIPPGWTYVVKMHEGWGGCKKYMKVWTEDGREHAINKGQPVDVCSNTTVTLGTRTN